MKSDSVHRATIETGSLWTPSRRQFLAGGAALGSTVLALRASHAQTPVPNRGGHLRLGMANGSTTDTLDPRTIEDSFSLTLGFTYLNRLTEVNSEGQLVPELATEWESTPDAKQWVFRLRQGVEFHNGKPLDADDVIASFHLNMGETKSPLREILKQVLEIHKEDKHTLRFVLASPNAGFPAITSGTQLGILPAVDGKADPVAGIGTGGYSISSFNPGERADLRRNENYFKDDSAHFDSAEMLVILDAAARQNALVTGEVDAMHKVDLKTVAMLKRVEEIEVLSVTGSLHYTLPMRADQAPFNNRDARLAMKYAIDRNDLLEKILRGYGTIANDQPISSSYEFYNPDLPPFGYDIDKAKFHAKKGGLDGQTIQLSVAEATFPGAVDLATLYSEYAAKAGIRLVVDRVANDGYWTNTWKKRTMCGSYWSGRPTEDWMLSQVYEGSSSDNESGWKNAEFDKLLLSARSEMDQEKRRDMYCELQRLVCVEGSTIIPMFANHVMGLSRRVGHKASIGGNWDLDGAKAIERWWFA